MDLLDMIPLAHNSSIQLAIGIDDILMPAPREPFKRDTVEKGQLKKQAGFLISRSLTLFLAPPRVEGII